MADHAAARGGPGGTRFAGRSSSGVARGAARLAAMLDAPDRSRGPPARWFPGADVPRSVARPASRARTRRAGTSASSRRHRSSGHPRPSSRPSSRPRGADPPRREPPGDAAPRRRQGDLLAASRCGVRWSATAFAPGEGGRGRRLDPEIPAGAAVADAIHCTPHGLPIPLSRGDNRARPSSCRGDLACNACHGKRPTRRTSSTAPPATRATPVPAGTPTPPATPPRPATTASPSRPSSPPGRWPTPAAPAPTTAPA